MKVTIISIDHYLQLLEEDTDSKNLRTSKVRLREMLEDLFVGGSIARVFEESSRTKESIALHLASRREPPVPWRNISTTEEERRTARIYEALSNRPSSPDATMEFTIEKRIPADDVREDLFASHIVNTSTAEEDVLVLLGDMHVQAVADRLVAKGHNVTILSELVTVKRWE